MAPRPPLHSRSGCVACKQRRKKCDEGKPTCATCTRLRLLCFYAAPRKRATGQRDDAVEPEGSRLASPRYQVLALKGNIGHDATEEDIVSSVPSLMKIFWTPTSAEEARELPVLQQMMHQQSIVRNAVVACFTNLLGSGEALTRTKHMALDRALCQLQTKVASGRIDKDEGMETKLALNFVGLMEAIDPSMFVDLLDHWKGTTLYTNNFREHNVHSVQALPRKEHLLCQESLLFHVSVLAIFSRDNRTLQTIRQALDRCLQLETLNPEGPDRLSKSILLSGQYQIFEMAFQLTYLLRTSGNEQVRTENLHDMLAAVRHRQSSLDADFGLVDSSVLSTRPKSMLCRVYHIFCNALQVCILLLLAPMKRRIQCIDTLAAESLQDFDCVGHMLGASQTRHCSHVLWIALWPFQITACATRQQSDLQRLSDHFEVWKPALDEGSQARTQALLDRLRQLGTAQRDDSVAHQLELDMAPPKGLNLLFHSNGVLG